MWTIKIKIVNKNQCPRSKSHGSALLLKFSDKNIIAQFLTRTNFIHFTYFRVFMDHNLSDDLLFGMRPLLFISFKPIFEISSKVKRVLSRVLNVYMCINKSMYLVDIYSKQSIISNNKSSFKL